MKMKKIMFITFLILAVLTIGAASAADDVSSDNVTVSDDSDVVAAYDEEEAYDDYDITVTEYDNEDGEETGIIYLNPNDDEYDSEDNYVEYMELPTDAKGSFRIFNGNEEVGRLDINEDDDEHWELDEDEDILCGTIYPKDLTLSKIHNGDILYFKYYDLNDEDEYVPIESLTMVYKVALIDNTMRLTEYDEEAEEESVEAEFTETPIIMDEGWEDTEIITFTVDDGIEGNIVIKLNGTIVFNKTLSEFEYYDEDSNEYTITIGELNVKQAGKYTIQYYFYDNEGNILYPYDEEEEPEILALYESQTEIVDDIIIKVVQPTRVTGDESFITIDSTASKDDEVTIQIDGKEPITIKLNDVRIDEDTEEYLIGYKELGIPLKEGEYNLNITFHGKKLTGKKITLETNILISFEEEIIYNKFDEGFVFIGLEDGDFDETNMEGKINLTIKDSTGNIVYTFEKDLDEIQDSADESEVARVIKTNDLKTELNGEYTVVVRYFDGNTVETQAEGKVTFKTLTPEDYGASINSNIKDKNDSVITFTALPLDYNIIVEIDGERTTIKESDLENWLDKEKGVYYINHTKLGILTDGFHSIKVYLNNPDYTDLASGNIFVDVEENIDPNLTISVANIEEGKVATVLITTNSSFTGDVMVQVANANYTVNVVKGQGNLTIPGLKANTYTATALFKTNGIFNDSAKNATFKVTSKPVTPAKKSKVIKLTLKKAKVKKSAKKLVLKATLKINGKAPKKGTKIKFTFKGKKYTGKTNKKGVAKVTIKKKVLKKLKVGKKVKITAKYSTKKVKKTVKVKK